MRIAFAEDVLLDVLSGKGRASSELLDAVAEGKADGFVMLSTLTAIRRIAAENIGPKKASEIVSELAFILEILPMPQKEDILTSMNSKSDLDAALLMASAPGNADLITAKSKKAFAESKVPVRSPREILSEF